MHKPLIAPALSFQLSSLHLPSFYVERTRRCLETLQQLLTAEPRLKFSIQVSGQILDIFRKNNLNTFWQLLPFVQNKQLELVGGFYYEPQLSLATPADLVAHFELTRTYWDEYDQTAIKGLWLPNADWSTDLPEVIAELGLSYIVIDRGVLPPSNPSLPSAFFVSEESLSLATFVEEIQSLNNLKQLIEGDISGPLIYSSVVDEIELFESGVDETIVLSKLEATAQSLLSTKDAVFVTFSEAIANIADRAPTVALSLLRPQDPHQGGLQRFAPRLEKLLRARLAHLNSQLQPLPAYVQNKAGNYFRNQELMKSAQKWRLAAQHRPVLSNSIEAEQFYRFSRHGYASILHAHVDMEKILYAEIDPAEGWLKHEYLDFDSDGFDESIVDTPFLRLYFKPNQGGSLFEFDYKPRKLNLLNTRHLPHGNHSFVGRLLSSEEISKWDFIEPPQSGDETIIRCAKDIFQARFGHPVSLKSQPEFRANLYKHYTVKAGVGAHLANSTTGFSIEYWLEASEQPPEDCYLSLELFLNLQSGNNHGVNARTLSALGAASDTTIPLAEHQTLSNSDVEGGLYGLRLIDGIEQFVIELRSSKPLAKVLTIPLVKDAAQNDTRQKDTEQTDDGFGGIGLRFVVEAKRLLDFHNPYTLFLSIP